MKSSNQHTNPNSPEKKRRIGESDEKVDSIVRKGYLLRRRNGDYISMEACMAWAAWQAARRAPVVPQKAIDATQTMIDRLDGIELAHDIRENLCAAPAQASAPKLPETEPVQLPDLMRLIVRFAMSQADAREWSGRFDGDEKAQAACAEAKQAYEAIELRLREQLATQSATPNNQNQ